MGWAITWPRVTDHNSMYFMYTPERKEDNKFKVFERVYWT